MNLLLRGQSNALLFADTGGLARLEKGLEAALPGVNINLLYQWNDAGGANTINSGTEFLTEWMSGTSAGKLEQGLLNYINGLSADIKDNPTLELWMHNESDQKKSGEFSTADWRAAFEANKGMVEGAFGRSVTTEFVPIRYNWGDIGSILDGMKAEAADGHAAGVDMSAYDLAKMDWGGTANTEHMSGSDAAVIADALAKSLVDEVQALAGGGAPSPAPTPAPAPATPATPVELSAGSGPDTLVLKVSQDAYQGSAQYTVSVDGKQVGETFTAGASHAAGQSDTLTLKGEWGAGAHSVEVKLLNDAWGGTAATDRNLYVDGATYNGPAVAGAAQPVLSDAQPGRFSFTEAAAPAPTPTPAPTPEPIIAGSGPDSLVLEISQDAYQGSAQYTVSVDGQQVGGTFTASAFKSSGRKDTLILKGDWAPGEHKVEVAFINDKWDGTAATDRNLYVDAASYNGQAVGGASAALMSAGTEEFAFAEAAAPEAKAGTDAADLFDATEAGGVFTGKGGRDLFVFEAGDGRVTITDFATRTDKLVFVDLDKEDVAAAAATENGASGLLVTYGDGGSVFLAGVAGLAERDMVFA